MPAPTALFFTFGCKLNQDETEALASAARTAGFHIQNDAPSPPLGGVGGGSPVTPPYPPQRGGLGHHSQVPSPKSQVPRIDPSFIVVNTCTVTSGPEQKARRLIRKCLAAYPNTPLLVTGCYAQVDAASIAALGGAGRLFVVPGSQKQRLLDFPAVLARGLAEGGEPVSLAARALAAPPPAADGAFRFAPEAFSFHSRAFLKVQDGCDRRCAYCRVSLARGPSRSLPPDEALRRLRALEDAGFCETILTGVNLSQYASGGLDLGGLIHHLIAGTSTMRLRISSLEPEAVSPAFCEAISSSRVRPHFHLSVQSASPRVLARMGRPYGPEDLAAACARLRAAKDDPFLACDIIAGFPGETPADFAETLAFCRGALFAWIHAFRFSPRPDTAAWTLRPRVPEREACERVRALEEAARAGYAAYRRRWQGREVEAVILAAKNAAPPGAPALSENYLRLWLEPPPQGSLPPAGSLVLCRVREGESNTPSAEYVRSLSHRHSA